MAVPQIHLWAKTQNIRCALCDRWHANGTSWARQTHFWDFCSSVCAPANGPTTAKTHLKLHQTLQWPTPPGAKTLADTDSEPRGVSGHGRPGVDTHKRQNLSRLQQASPESNRVNGRAGGGGGAPGAPSG